MSARSASPSLRAGHRGADLPASRLPALRRLPIPLVEPQDAQLGDARHAALAAEIPHTQGALALAFPVADREHRTDPDEDLFGPQPTGTAQLPDVHRTCSQVVQAVVEVLAGVRPATQLVRWLAPDLYTALQRRAALGQRLQPGAPAGRRAVVRRVRVCLPADGVAEASAVVLDRGRVRAVAVRLEGLDGRWRVTALEVG